MNRDIKFRIWDSRNKEMSTQIIDQSDWGDYLCDFGDHSQDIAPEWMIWLQWTGLKDKNGVEIYEGDIVKRYDSIGRVDWGYSCDVDGGNAVTPCFAFYDLKLDFEDGGLWGEPNKNNGNLEVIGNIYENPELLAEDSNG